MLTLNLPLDSDRKPYPCFRDVVSEHGYDECKRLFQDFRPMMIRMGDKMREIDEDVWIDFVLFPEKAGKSVLTLDDQQIRSMLLFVSPHCELEESLLRFRRFFSEFKLDTASEQTRYFVVEDVRTPREAWKVRSKGGIVIGIDRPGVGAPNIQEALSIPSIVRDYTVCNDDTLDTLAERLSAILESHQWE